jgi:hypothetical protein
LEVVGSKPSGGMLYFGRFKEMARHSLSDVKHEQHNFNRHGAEAARRAHNPEVTRSKRVAGIISLRSFYRSDQPTNQPNQTQPL